MNLILTVHRCEASAMEHWMPLVMGALQLHSKQTWQAPRSTRNLRIIEPMALDNGNKRSRYVRPRRQKKRLTGSASMSNACISSRQRLRSHRCKSRRPPRRARGELFVSADGDRDRHQPWLLRWTNSLPVRRGPRRGFVSPPRIGVQGSGAACPQRRPRLVQT